MPSSSEEFVMTSLAGVFAAIQSLMSPQPIPAALPLVADIRTEQADFRAEPVSQSKECLTALASNSKSSSCPPPPAPPTRKQLAGGQRFEIVTDQSGQPLSSETSETIKGKPVQILSYKVRAPNGAIGWIPSEQLTTPAPQESANQRKKTSCERFDPITRVDSHLKKDAENILEQVNLQLPIGTLKSEKELDHYMCLYREIRIPLSDFQSKLSEFKTAAREASEAFKIPYPMVMCTMLTESRMFFDSHEEDQKDKDGKPVDKYIGLGQLGGPLVKDLQQAIAKSPYSQMWQNFQEKNPNAEFTQNAIRRSADPTSAMAAIALSLRWMYDVRFNAPGVPCKGCSTNDKFNRKDLYMLVTGYNWGPYQLNQVGNKTAAQMVAQDPPPEQSRNYMLAMEACMEKGRDKVFRDPPADMKDLKEDRLDRIKILTKEIHDLRDRKPAVADFEKTVESRKKELGKLKRMVRLGLSPDYVRNEVQCNSHYPLPASEQKTRK
jgi:hypothetical protein